MPDTSKEFVLVRGRRMRVTRLNSCGQTVLGPDSVVITSGFISVALTANTEEGEAINVTNANGDRCISDTPPPKFVDYTANIALCGVNPDLIKLLTGMPIVMDSQATPQGVGFRMNSKVDLSASGFGLELWSNVPSSACSGSVPSYGYFLLPFFQGGVVGDFSIENAAVNFTITGARTKDGSGWGVGPYNVVKNSSNVDSPLKTAITVGDHLHMELTTVAPPAAVVGATNLGTAATSAVAGSPGTYLPANSYGRADFASMTGLTASPNTSWTTGQYVVNRDGSTAHWNGTAWVAGPKP